MLAAGGGISLLGLGSCKFGNSPDIPCGFEGADANFGHLLRSIGHNKTDYSVEVPVVIIGGGISGLVAAHSFWKKGMEDFLVIDNGGKIGGNSVGGKNEYSSYPWGAHYLTLPNSCNGDLIKFLEQYEFIQGYTDQGVPIYREEHLCHYPQERLFIKNRWQHGLIPEHGVLESDAIQIKRFLKLAEEFKNIRTENGKYIYDVPLAFGAYGDDMLKLDSISFVNWLKDQEMNSEVLYWYLNYGTRDDYGTSIEDISAFAGLHYYASRRGDAANGATNSVLTWPEGNSHLVEIMASKFRDKIRSSTLAYNLRRENDKLIIDCITDGKKGSFSIICDKCVLATPQYINTRILSGETKYMDRKFPALEYSPWIVANITVKDLDVNHVSADLCWDNVIYGSESLGYVYAQHQNLNHVHGPKVITWYYPVTHRSGKEARNFLRNTNEQYWLNKIIEDLSIAHPNIQHKIMDVRLWQWGHAMVKPLPGVITAMGNNNLVAPIDDKIFFCHSDLSGISLFEEAFYHGMRVSNEVLNVMNV